MPSPTAPILAAMNAHTKVLPSGKVVIPAEALASLGLPAGTTLSVRPHPRGVDLRLEQESSLLSKCTTWDDLMAFPAYDGLPKTVEDISSVPVDWLRDRYARKFSGGPVRARHHS